MQLLFSQQSIITRFAMKKISKNFIPPTSAHRLSADNTHNGHNKGYDRYISKSSAPQHIFQAHQRITDPHPAIAHPHQKMCDPLAKIIDPHGEITDPLTEITDPLTEITDPLSEITDPLSEITDPLSEITDPLTGIIDPHREICTSHLQGSRRYCVRRCSQYAHVTHGYRLFSEWIYESNLNRQKITHPRFSGAGPIG